MSNLEAYKSAFVEGLGIDESKVEETLKYNDILRIKLTGYVDTLNLHIMNDGSGSFIGCMCR